MSQPTRPIAALSDYDDLFWEARERIALNYPWMIPKILLVDDDHAFRKIMSRVADGLNLALTPCDSLLELGDLPRWKFDVAIVDYQLRGITGLSLAQDLERRLRRVPVILISGTDEVDERSTPWPDCIKGFYPKAAGYRAILRAAVTVGERAGWTPVPPRVTPEE